MGIPYGIPINIVSNTVILILIFFGYNSQDSELCIKSLGPLGSPEG